MHEKYSFLFVRQDIPVVHQIIQTNHATQKITALLNLPEKETPNIVLVGVPDNAALRRVLLKLKQHALQHYVWDDPDFEWGVTVLATAPLTFEQKQLLANYRLYKEGRGGGQPPCGVNPDTSTSSPVTQAQEY